MLIIWTIVTLRNAETTDLSVIMRTVVNHMQATGELGAFSSQWGPFMQSFMSGQSTASGGGLSVNGVQAFDCLLRGYGQDYRTIFAGYMCLPGIAFGLALVVFGVVRGLKLVPVITPELSREIDEDVKNFGANARTAIIKVRYPMYMVVVTTNCVIMFTLYQTIITQCANALQCATFVFNDHDGVIVSQSYLQSDYSILCGGGNSPLTTPALIFAALYGLGIPLAFTAGYLFVNDTVNMPQLTKLMFMFLCGGYKEQYFFWQNLIMIRKLVLVLMMVFLKDTQELLNYCAMWIMSVALVLQVWLQPAEKDEHNLVESISLSVIVITLNLGLLYFWDLSSFAKSALTLTLILITVGVIVVFAYYCFYAVLGEITAIYKEVMEVVANWGKDEKKKKRVRLNQLMDMDDDPDLPTIGSPIQSRYGRFQGRMIDPPVEADFDEYSTDDDDNSGDEDDDAPRYARSHVIEANNQQYDAQVTKKSQWDFDGVDSTPSAFTANPGWKPARRDNFPLNDEYKDL